jgi:hypothetical protein
MSRRNEPTLHHGSPHELRLWVIVDSLVTGISGEVQVTKAIPGARVDGFRGRARAKRTDGPAIVRSQS